MRRERGSESFRVICGYNRKVIPMHGEKNRTKCAACAHTGGAEFYKRLM
jgi:hypothetical protein